MSQRLTLLGSTGSIGQSTLDVVRQLGERFSVYSLVAGRNTDALVAQILEFRPAVVVVEAEATRDELREKLKARGLRESFWPDLEFGPTARMAVAMAPEVDFVMSAIVGVAGLEATFAAVATGKKIGLANKEVLVASGQLVMDAVKATGVEMIPVDSEHNGAHQCLRAGERGEALRLILTASGGPFRNTPASEFEAITVAQALKHPTWKMGSRITIDSATMMNKGFEVIEACWLFDFTPDEVDVVVHPTSSVHAMVEYSDGSVMAQISTTDMRMPIQYAMTWPARMDAPVPRMDWTQPRTMEFFPPDLKKFRALQLAYDAQRTGGSATCTLNAADEIAVEAFLQERISFPGIARVVEETLNAVPVRTPRSIGEVLEIDLESRRTAATIVERQVAAVRG
jgi:1-deoxy-D-xylulose-5-phosphate reductoisomerase